MRGLLLSGALGALLAGGLVGAVDAAVASVCTKTQKTLTISIPVGEPAAELDKGPNGEVIVRLGDTEASCAASSGQPFDARSLHSIELGQDDGPAPTVWLLSETRWQPTITLHDDAVDTLQLVGSPGSDAWQAVAGDAPSLSTDGDPNAAEILLDTAPSSVAFEAGAGDDVVDLATAGWTSETSIDTGAGADTISGGAGADEIVPGAGADTVEAGPGDDHVLVDADADPDTVRPGGGHDELDLSAGSASGAVVDPTTPGGDGVAGNDDYGDFETVRGTAGPDRFVASELGMTAVGGSGDDTFTSGSGDDTFYGGTAGDPAEARGHDTVTYADATSGITLSPTDDPGVEQATGDGSDVLASVETLIGSPQADRVETMTIERVRPGLGDDAVGFNGGSGYIVAEPGMDGNDTSLSCATWDYSSRTAPLSLTADGAANDGMRRENDDVGAECDRVTILGGSGDDRIAGNASRNVLAGGRGDDRVLGKPGGDYLWGGPGADQMTGGSGPDDVAGGKGADTIRETGGRPNGADVLHGNAGRDTLTYSGRGSGVSVTNGNLRCDDGAEGEGDCVTGHDPFEIVVGTSSADRLSGSTVDERFYGERGADVLLGGRGDDALFGAAGNDRLNGNGGRDTLHGGGGGDRFHARDSVKDTLKGGYGRDLARRDRVDAAYSIEGRF